MSRTVWAVSDAKSRAPATGLVTVPTRPLPSPEKKPLTPPSVFTPSTVEVMMLVIPPMIPRRGKGSSMDKQQVHWETFFDYHRYNLTVAQ